MTPTNVEIAQMVGELRRLDNCEVYPQTGFPSVPRTLPSDLTEFYGLTGGAMLFKGQDYSIEVVPPEKFVRANPVIVGEDGLGDISFDWFIIARTGEQYVTIDLAPERLGRCYDSFWDRHGVPGECQIVATNFGSFLEQLIEGRGTYWYWLGNSFNHLGDAYDG